MPFFTANSYCLLLKFASFNQRRARLEARELFSRFMLIISNETKSGVTSIRALGLGFVYLMLVLADSY